MDNNKPVTGQEPVRMKSSLSMTRRTFTKITVTGALAKTALAAPSEASKAKRLPELAPGIKISLQVPTDPGDEDLQFARQLGVDYVNIPSGGEQATLENFQRWKQRVETAGLKVWNIGNSNVHNMPEVTLNLPGRDQKIEEYKQYLRNLGKAGIGYTTYAHMGNGIWTSGRTMVRGASAREFDQNSPDARGNWDGKVFTGPLSH